MAADPDTTQLFQGDGLPATYEQVWVDYLLGFPTVPSTGLPSVPAADPRYAPGGEGRITIVGSGTG